MSNPCLSREGQCLTPPQTQVFKQRCALQTLNFRASHSALRTAKSDWPNSALIAYDETSSLWRRPAARMSADKRRSRGRHVSNGGGTNGPNLPKSTRRASIDRISPRVHTSKKSCNSSAGACGVGSAASVRYSARARLRRSA